MKAWADMDEGQRLDALVVLDCDGVASDDDGMYFRLVCKAVKTGDVEYGYYGDFMWNALMALGAQDSSPERHAQVLGAIFWPENRDALGRVIYEMLGGSQ